MWITVLLVHGKNMTTNVSQGSILGTLLINNIRNDLFSLFYKLVAVCQSIENMG